MNPARMPALNPAALANRATGNAYRAESASTGVPMRNCRMNTATYKTPATLDANPI
jgi:hypothetical protein